MKRLGFIVALLLGVNMLWAQPPGGGQRVSIEERQLQELKSLKTALDLDKDQVKGVKEFQSDFAKSMETIRSGMGQNNDRKAMREEVDKLRDKFDADVKTLLTDEQKPKYLEYLKKRDEQMQQQRQGKGRGQGQGQGKNRNIQ